MGTWNDLVTRLAMVHEGSLNLSSEGPNDKIQYILLKLIDRDILQQKCNISKKNAVAKSRNWDVTLKMGCPSNALNTYAVQVHKQ